MKEIFTHQDFTRVGYYQSILEEAGIPTFVRNMSAYNTMSELPAAIFFPTLCVVRDGDYEQAMELLREVHYSQSPQREVDWKCPKCGEEVPKEFDTCWNCGGADATTK